MTTIVFIVDDEQPVIDVLSQFLERFIDELEVVSAQNGMEAIEKATELAEEDRLPHITLMDLKMPVMDGIECTKKLTELGVENVHILTAHVDRDLIGRAVSVGAKGLLMKSEGLRTIATKVTEMVRGVRQSA
ncbi:MAG: response regulator transcription factor [Candidatus Thorarchaeota archaeon]|nr:MAG: response regulator transcription factor [Candidatus Thorarchaeota archaeon]